MTINPQNIKRSDFAKIIKLLNDDSANFKNNQDRVNKNKAELKKIQDAQLKLENAIKQSQETQVQVFDDNGDPKLDNSGKPVTISLYEKLGGKDKENSFNLAMFAVMLEEANSGLEEKDKKKYDVSAKPVDPNYDFVDRTKHFFTGFLRGNGFANTLTKTCLGVAIGELLTQGATRLLVGQGLLTESFGLFGLGKIAVSKMPLVWEGLKTAGSFAMGNFPIALIGGAAFVALKAIPVIKNLCDKAGKRFENEHAVANGINKLGYNTQSGMEIN